MDFSGIPLLPKGRCVCVSIHHSPHCICLHITHPSAHPSILFWVVLKLNKVISLETNIIWTSVYWLPRAIILIVELIDITYKGIIFIRFKY